MIGLQKEELVDKHVYRCLLSGRAVQVVKKGGETSIRGVYFYEGEFRVIDIRDGQLIKFEL